MSETQTLEQNPSLDNGQYGINYNGGEQYFDGQMNGNENGYENYDENYAQQRFEDAVVLLQCFFRVYCADLIRLERLKSFNIEKVGDVSSRKLTIVKKPGNKGRRPPTRGHHKSIVPIDPNSEAIINTKPEVESEVPLPSTPSTPKVRGGMGFGMIDLTGGTKLRKTPNQNEDKNPSPNNSPFPKLRKSSEPNDGKGEVKTENTPPPRRPPPDPNNEVKTENSPPNRPPPVEPKKEEPKTEEPKKVINRGPRVLPTNDQKK